MARDPHSAGSGGRAQDLLPHRCPTPRTAASGEHQSGSAGGAGAPCTFLTNGGRSWIALAAMPSRGEGPLARGSRGFGPHFAARGLLRGIACGILSGTSARQVSDPATAVDDGRVGGWRQAYAEAASASPSRWLTPPRWRPACVRWRTPSRQATWRGWTSASPVTPPSPLATVRGSPRLRPCAESVHTAARGPRRRGGSRILGRRPPVAGQRTVG